MDAREWTDSDGVVWWVKENRLLRDEGIVYTLLFKRREGDTVEGRQARVPLPLAELTGEELQDALKSTTGPWDDP